MCCFRRASVGGVFSRSADRLASALVEGRADWGKLQSVFAVTRLLGGSEALAWTLQLGLAVAVANRAVAALAQQDLIRSQSGGS